MELKYYSGKQRIQRESILECCGTPGPDMEHQNAARTEADFLVAAAEERAKAVPNVKQFVVVANYRYTVICG